LERLDLEGEPGTAEVIQRPRTEDRRTVGDPREPGGGAADVLEGDRRRRLVG
jgi:hypothetical protein